MRNFLIWMCEPLFIRLTAHMAACGLIAFFGSGGDDPPKPDYQPLQAASDRALEISTRLGQEQLAETRRQYDNNMAVAAPVVAAQLDSMRTERARGDAYYADYVNTYRPVAQGLVSDALAFNTGDAKERFARSAAADIETQQANQVAQSDRQMAASGVNPNSGRFAAIRGQQSVLNAAQRAGATTNARVQADDLGRSRLVAAYGLGSNLPGAANTATAAALGAGNSAVGNNAQAGDRLVAGTASAATTALGGVSANIQGLGSILNSQTNAFDSANAANASRSAGYMSLVGAGLGAASRMYSTSSANSTKQEV